MCLKIKGEYFDSSFMLVSLLAWYVTAAVLLIISSIVLSKISCREQMLGYVSSGISLLAAYAAGLAASGKRKAGSIYTALLIACVLVTMLLTLGFLIKGQSIEASSVMSVVSFSFSGSLLGTITPTGRTKRKRKYIPKP